jgi:hypothetical protein
MERLNFLVNDFDVRTLWGKEAKRNFIKEVRKEMKKNIENKPLVIQALQKIELVKLFMKLVRS